jgi:hypothetical protein
MLASLLERNAADLVADFIIFLSCIPFSLLLPYETYGQTVFFLARAGQGVTAEGEASDRQFDAYLGDIFIVQMWLAEGF